MAIYKKDNGKYIFRKYYTTLTGERKQYKSKEYDSRKDVENAEAEFILKKTDVQVSNLTIKELIDSHYLFKKEKVKISTLSDIEKKSKYLKPLYKIKVEQFTLSQFNNWKDEINKLNLSTTTKNSIYKVLRSTLNYGIKYYDLKIPVLNKMTNFTSPNELKKEMLFFDYDEFNKFIKEEDNLMWNTFFKLLYFCGLRKGEAKALTFKDIDFNRHTINISKSIISKVNGINWLVSTPKTKGSIRTIQFPKQVEMGLKLLYNEAVKYKDYNNNWFVFGYTEPLKDTTIAKRKNDLCKESGVKQIRIHDFRHSCASLLINQKASITLIAKYLGHTNIATTLNTYSHFYNNEYDTLMEKINKL